MKYKVITAIIALFIICIVALIKDINSGIVASCAALIAGLGGYTIAKFKKP